MHAIIWRNLPHSPTRVDHSSADKTGLIVYYSLNVLPRMAPFNLGETRNTN